MGLLKIGGIAIFGPCLRWADMRTPGRTTLKIAITGDHYDEVVLIGDDDKEFRSMFEEGRNGPMAAPMAPGSERNDN